MTVVLTVLLSLYFWLYITATSLPILRNSEWGEGRTVVSEHDTTDGVKGRRPRPLRHAILTSIFHTVTGSREAAMNVTANVNTGSSELTLPAARILRRILGVN
jgi:hypothetical protein